MKLAVSCSPSLSPFASLAQNLALETCHYKQKLTWFADFMVLFIAIHTALHIFKPRARLFRNGLYHIRWAVYGTVTILPITLASLAFINTQTAYLSQGSFCSLPIRPFWYRLALAWVPRYCIWIVILGIYGGIYYHVKYEMKQYKALAQDASHRSFPSSDENSPFESQNPSGRGSTRGSVGGITLRPPSSHLLGSSFPPSKKTSETPSAAFTDSTVVDSDPPSPGMATVQDNRISAFQPLSPLLEYEDPVSIKDFGGRGADNDRGISLQQAPMAYPNYANPEPSPTSNRFSLSLSSHMSSYQPSVATRKHQPSYLSADLFQGRMAAHHAEIQRQLRLLFVYPFVYIVMWIVPFVLHCMQYSFTYAQHPPYVLAALAHFCVTTMGAADCILFTLRERPWRHITDSDGTFFGSFMFWRKSDHTSFGASSYGTAHACVAASQYSNATNRCHPGMIPEQQQQQPPLFTSPFAAVSGPVFGAAATASKSMMMPASTLSPAHARLQMEREERRRENRVNAEKPAPPGGRLRKGSSAWFDRAMSVAMNDAETSHRP